MKTALFLLFSLLTAFSFITAPEAIVSEGRMLEASASENNGQYAFDQFSASEERAFRPKEDMSQESLPLQKEGTTYLNPSPEAAINASIIPACNGVAELISTLRPTEKEKYRPLISFQGNSVLLKILFRVTIAPNAP